MLKPLMSHAEIARRLSLSKVHVQRLERSALEKMRKYLEPRLGSEYFEDAAASLEEPPR